MVPFWRETHKKGPPNKRRSPPISFRSTERKTSPPADDLGRGCVRCHNFGNDHSVLNADSETVRGDGPRRGIRLSDRDVARGTDGDCTEGRVVRRRVTRHDVFAPRRGQQLRRCWAKHSPPHVFKSGPAGKRSKPGRPASKPLAAAKLREMFLRPAGQESPGPRRHVTLFFTRHLCSSRTLFPITTRRRNRANSELPCPACPSRSCWFR